MSSVYCAQLHAILDFRKYFHFSQYYLQPFLIPNLLLVAKETCSLLFVNFKTFVCYASHFFFLRNCTVSGVNVVTGEFFVFIYALGFYLGAQLYLFTVKYSVVVLCK